jgi:putative oxidoreductase
LLALAQTLAGLFVVAGVWTRVSALAAGAFLAATIVLNAENGWFWMHGGIEYPLLWAIAALAVALLGAGRFSLDAVASHHREISP